MPRSMNAAPTKESRRRTGKVICIKPCRLANLSISCSVKSSWPMVSMRRSGLQRSLCSTATASPMSSRATLGRLSVFGMDLQCAQCHDHPLVDDYLQADYYGLVCIRDAQQRLCRSEEQTSPPGGRNRRRGSRFQIGLHRQHRREGAASHAEVAGCDRACREEGRRIRQQTNERCPRRAEDQPAAVAFRIVRNIDRVPPQSGQSIVGAADGPWPGSSCRCASPSQSAGTSASFSSAHDRTQRGEV